MVKNTNTGSTDRIVTVLVSGANGMIGKRLTDLLVTNGYRVHHLVRQGAERDPRVASFEWDVYKGTIDPGCLDGVDAVVHLAGESIAALAWSNRRKLQIVESRTRSIRLIYSLMREAHTVKRVVSASAVGYYGNRGDELLDEESGAGMGFLADCCRQWEKAVDEAPEGVTIVKLRTGIVLHKDDGALAPMAATVKLGLGAPLGSGKQWMSWIHLDDAAAMYRFALEKAELSGTFNMATPNPVRNADFTKALAAVFNKPLWMPNVPATALRLLMGQRYHVALDSNRVASQKIHSAGFRFSYLRIDEALKAIYE